MKYKGERTKLTFDNGTQVDYGYERNDDVSWIEMAFSGTSLEFGYEFNDAQKLVSQSVSDAKCLWFPTNARSFTFDPVNNLNQYPKVNGTIYSYNLDGCLTSDGTWTFGYDPERQLVSAANGTVFASYGYDPLHRRIEKTVNDDKTRYLYSGWQCIGEYNGISADGTLDTLQNRFVYGTQLDEPLIQISASDERKYLYADRLGSIVGIADDAGTVLKRLNYSPYGESESISDITFCFTGQRFDEETGLYYWKNRYYSPVLGRFLQPDPVTIIRTDQNNPAAVLDLYDYANNDPMNRKDPDGRAILAAPLVPAAILLVLAYLYILWLIEELKKKKKCPKIEFPPIDFPPIDIPFPPVLIPNTFESSRWRKKRKETGRWWGVPNSYDDITNNIDDTTKEMNDRIKQWTEKLGRKLTASEIAQINSDVADGRPTELGPGFEDVGDMGTDTGSDVS